MFTKPLSQSLLVAACVLGTGPWAAAQMRLYDPKPLSSVGGPTGEALNQVYRSDVGTGYTGSSLNTLALQYGQGKAPYVGQSTTRSSGPSVGTGLGATLTDKPFSSFSPEPTTSPYLNLFREDFEGNSDVNYNTLVRPQLQQQQFNQQLQRQTLDQARKLETLSAREDFNPQGDKNEFPTGHKTVYHYMGHYYQMPAAKRKR